MLKLLFITPDKNRFDGFESVLLEDDGVDLVRINSGQEALKISAEGGFDLVIADEDLGNLTGLEFAKKLVMINPLINCALISSLSAEAFHEKSEGLGIMARLPINPGPEHAQELVHKLRQLNKLLG